ncbi:MAG: hypothetical protein GY710_06280 [Desulfobacteraceae bacterium]|nr:hypothetical protein [Desulfobacteraceae bacterium]
MELILATLGSILTSALKGAAVALVGMVVRSLHAKTKIIISEASKKKLDEGVVDIVNYVEEYSKGINDASNKTQIKGPHKLAMAVDEIIKNNTGILEEEAKVLVHSTLSKIPGLGATSQKPLT